MEPTGPRIGRTLWQALRHGRKATIQRSRTSIAIDAIEDVDTTQVPRPFEEIPGPKMLPFVGSLLDYTPLGPYTVEKMMEASLDRYRNFGKIWRESFAGANSVNIIDPRDVEILFKNDGKTPNRPSLEPLKMARKMYKRNIGVANLQGAEWRRIRSGVQSFVMRPKSVAQYVPDLDTIAEDFIALMKQMKDEDGEITDFQNEIYKWALESVAKVSLDTRFGCLEREVDPNSEAQMMIRATGDFMETLGKLMFGIPFYKYFSTPTWRKFLQCQDAFFRTAQKHVDLNIARVKELTEKGELNGQANMLVSLLGREELSYEEIIVLPVELMMGGIDTTSHTLVFNLYTLATNPDKQAKLYEEVMNVIPRDGAITAEALQKMVYLKACTKETFRKFPLALGNARVTSKDMVLSGYQIPAGTMVRSHNITGWLPEYFTEPEKFIPERWIRGDVRQGNSNPYSLLPFGHGPRMCLGRRVAEQELQIIMAKLVQNFHIEWHHGEMNMRMRLVHAPDKPARFNFIDRK